MSFRLWIFQVAHCRIRRINLVSSNKLISFHISCFTYTHTPVLFGFWTQTNFKTLICCSFRRTAARMFSKTLKTTYLQTLFYSFLNILLKQKVEKRNSSTEFLEDLHIQSIAISKIYKEAKRCNIDMAISYEFGNRRIAWDSPHAGYGYVYLNSSEGLSICDNLKPANCSYLLSLYISSWWCSIIKSYVLLTLFATDMLSFHVIQNDSDDVKLLHFYLTKNLVMDENDV